MPSALTQSSLLVQSYTKIKFDRVSSERALGIAYIINQYFIMKVNYF